MKKILDYWKDRKALDHWNTGKTENKNPETLTETQSHFNTEKNTESMTLET